MRGAEAVPPGAEGVPGAAMACRRESVHMVLVWNIGGVVIKHLGHCRGWLTFNAG